MDPFSLATANEIFAAFPEWRSFAREERADDGSTFLVVEVLPPDEANVERGLVIDTSNREVTVVFDCFHSHFERWRGDGDHFGAQAALEFVEGIINERVAVVSWWQGAVWRGSSLLAAGAAPKPPSWQAESDHVRVRSWKGSLNVDISA